MSDNKTTVRIDDALRREMRKACFERDVTQSEAIVAGLKMWLGIPPEPQVDIMAGFPKEDRELLGGFADLLRAGGGNDPIQREAAEFARRAVRLWLRLRREAGQ